MNWYKKAQAKFEFQEGQTLTYNYPKVPYRGQCIIEKINSDGTIDVIDHSGRRMSKVNPYFGSNPMFKEMLN